MIEYLASGAVRLTDDADPNRTETVAPGASAEDVQATILAFFGQPAAPRRMVRKSVVVARVIAAGKIDDAMALLMADAASFARWTAPDHPAVYHDDPAAVALLAAIGCDVDAIMAPDEEA